MAADDDFVMRLAAVLSACFTGCRRSRDRLYDDLLRRGGLHYDRLAGGNRLHYLRPWRVLGIRRYRGHRILRNKSRGLRHAPLPVHWDAIRVPDGCNYSIRACGFRAIAPPLLRLPHRLCTQIMSERPPMTAVAGSPPERKRSRRSP